MDHHIEKHELFTLIRFSGFLASDFEEEVRFVLREIFDKSAKGIIVDLKNTEFVSSNVLGLFYSLSNHASESNKKISFCNVNDDLKKIFIITGVVKYLHISCDEKEAEAHLLITE